MSQHDPWAGSASPAERARAMQQRHQSPVTEVSIQHVDGFMVGREYDPNIRVTAATPVQGRPAWHGEYRLGEGAWAMWLTVTNGSGDVIAYASQSAADAGARYRRYASQHS